MKAAVEVQTQKGKLFNFLTLSDKLIFTFHFYIDKQCIEVAKVGHSVSTRAQVSASNV